MYYDEPSKTLNQRVLITTNNVAHYILNILSDFSSPEAGVFLMKYNIDKVLNRYGEWEAINRLSVYKDLIAIP